MTRNFSLRSWRLGASNLFSDSVLQNSTKNFKYPGLEVIFDSSEAPSLLGIRAQTFRCPQDGRNNILVAGTAANVAAQVLAYLFFGRIGIFA